MTLITWPDNEAERDEFINNIFSSTQKEFIHNLITISEKLCYRVYIVGGFVRDTILGLPPTDLDIVVEGDASILAEEYKNRYGGIVVHHKRFMTTRLILPSDPSKNNNNAYDLVSARSEVYERSGALPTVKHGTIHEDIRRRDFTINTLAMSLNPREYGTLVDELNGVEDLRTGVVRILYNRSIIDDPTRIFRAARYAVRFNFTVVKDTQKEILLGAKKLSEISGQRIRNEIGLIMKEDRPGQVLSMLENWGIFEIIHPEIYPEKSYLHQDRSDRFEASADLVTINWTLWLMHLTEENIRKIDKRLNFPKHIRESIISASKIINSIDSYSGLPTSALVNKLNSYPLSSINAVVCTLPAGSIKDNFHEYITIWRHIKSKVSGDTLRNSGIPPGPIYQTILGIITDALLNGEVKTENDEWKLLNKLIRQLKEDNTSKNIS